MASDSILTTYSIILKALSCLLLVKTTSSHTEMLLNSGNVCKLDYDVANIKLRGGDNSAVVIRDGGYFSSWTGRYDFSCKFQVKVKDRDEGIYAVIQDLSFRKDENGECKDYVEFSVPTKDLTKILGLKPRYTRRFCGSMAPGMWLPPRNDDDDGNPEVDLAQGNLAPNAYIASGGEVAVEIYISRERLMPNQKLDVALVFTAYKKACHETHKTSLAHCRIGECIYSGLMDDGIQNCPYTSCADEFGCVHFRRESDNAWPKDLVGSGIGTKVTFGAVAAIILIILKFALCLWVCKRLHRRRPAPQQQIRHVVNPPFPVDRDTSMPSAPPLDPEAETKDVPPSYDSLFPVQLPVEPKDAQT